MAENFEREEKAFSEALRASVETESFLPLDASVITSSARASRPAVRLAGWGRGVAAAAAAVVLIAGVAFVLPRLGGAAASSAGTVAAAPEQADPREPALSGADRDTTAAASGPTEVVGDWQVRATPPLSARSFASGAWLDGRFYLVGGQLDQPCPANASCLAPSRLLRDGAGYDPATDTWRAIATAPVNISETAPVAVGGRLYYRVYDRDGQLVVSYDPAADAWTTLPRQAGDGELVAADDRLVSIAFSDETETAIDEIYDPAAGRWSRLPDDPLGASYNRAAVWVNGKLLLGAKELVAAPGSEKAPVVRLAELDLATSTWRRLPDSEVIGGGATSVSGLVVWPDQGSADGGEVNNWGRSYPMGGIYDPASGTWSELPALGAGGEGVLFSRADASVSGTRLLASGHLLDPAARTWTRLTPPPAGNLEGQTVVAGPDGLLVFGGWDSLRQTSGTAYLPLR